MTGLNAFAVAGVTVTKQTRQYSNGKLTRVVKVHWVADASGAVTSTAISGMHGFLVKAVTDPGATAPTASYDITLKDTSDGVVDAAKSLLIDRHTSNTEMIFPVTAAGELPIFFEPDTYTFALANNSVNAALGDLWLYFVDSL